MSLDTSVLLPFYYAVDLPIHEHCAPELGSAAECHLQPLERQVIRWPGFALLRLSCRYVITVMLLHCVCLTRSIRTHITVCSVSFDLLLSEFDISDSLKHLGVERPNLQGVSCRSRLDRGMTFPILYLIQEC